jgi:hypothetical protein
MANDPVKQLILSRRARFVAAALAGAGLAASGCDTQPKVCLDIVAPGGSGGATAGAGGQAGSAGTGGGAGAQTGGSGGADAG